MISRKGDSGVSMLFFFCKRRQKLEPYLPACYSRDLACPVCGPGLQSLGRRGCAGFQQHLSCIK
eukprot:1155104-Pelagomonas_calceolata.AAC.2